ncbi:MAG: DUF4886 domain-containing protein [Clostridiales bacterium]|nr:DUF4886 domain-containing protein [Clostridiales bacterium]
MQAKRIRVLLATLLIGAVFTGCASQVTPNEPVEDPPLPPAWMDDGVLKILTIGNSFSDDAMEYVWQIADDLGVEVSLGNLYIGGCTLATHAANAKANKGAYDYRTNTSGTWSTIANYKISDAITSQDWDFISLQQASGSSGMADTYNSDLNFLIDYVNALKPENAEIVWHMTWAYQQSSTHNEFPKYNRDQMTMYDAIVSAVETKVLDTEIYTVIPNGTAIQNARSSYLGDTLNRDGYHLDYYIGRYVAGITLFSKLSEVDVSGLAWKPANVDDNMKKVAIESAKNAIKTPFKVTPSKYDAEPALDIDLSKYVKLDLEIIPFAFYDSTVSGEYCLPRRGVSGLSQNYFTTRIFAKDELPVGTIITVESGWQYRPDAWVSLARQTGTRPGNISTRYVEITDDWWSNYNYRAFNVSKIGTPSLVGSEDDAEKALTIYVPKSAANEFDATDYTLLDLELQKFAFYNSTESTAPNSSANNSNQFYCSKRFTKAELPVGSVIILEYGWQYRPEAWRTEGVEASRPDNVKEHRVDVTEQWWGDCIYRAFNLSSVGGCTLRDVDNVMQNVLKIYVPKSGK